ncbi:MAG: SsrA-binding protein, partial [Patescibacteria group bacterium]
MPNLTVNKYAKSDYDLVEMMEGGLVLTGAEVKSTKAGNIKLQGAFLTVEQNGLWLKNAHIGRYKPAGVQEEYDPTRSRKVLVHKKELRKIRQKKTIRR